MSVQITDCTIRDGGYLLNKNSEPEFIKGIMSGLTKAGIDFVETGFLQTNVTGETLVYANSVDAKKYLPADHGKTQFLGFCDNSRYSIGYSIYLYAKEQYVKDSVKFVKINGVAATDENITNKTYPLTKIVYAVTRKDVPQESNARKLTKWLLTPAGQKVVEAGGYVKLYK